MKNKETLEEAAENYAKSISSIKPFFRENTKKTFIEGVKWQQEQFKNESTADYIDKHIVKAMVEVAKQKMFSEKDIEEYAEYYTNHVLTTQIGNPYLSIKDWCKQIKKK